MWMKEGSGEEYRKSVEMEVFAMRVTEGFLCPEVESVPNLGVARCYDEVCV